MEEAQSDSGTKSHQPDSVATLTAELLEGDSSQAALLALKLRLMAQAAPKRWKPSLQRIEADVRSGNTLEKAIQSNRSIPMDLKCLLIEACNVSDPAAMMMEAMNVQTRVWREWREFWTLLIYPAALLIASVLLALGVHIAVYYAIDFGYIEEFQLAGSEWIVSQWQDQQQAVLGAAIALAWVLVTAATIYWIGPPWAWLSVAGAIAAIGKPLRWISLHEILERYRLFLGQRLSTTQAATAVARSFQNSAQGAIAKRLASQIEQGVPLGKALGDCQLADSLCRPALYLLDMQSGDIQESLGQLSELLESLAEQRCRTLRVVLPLGILLLVMMIIWSLMSSYLVMISSTFPLISMFW